MMEIRELTAAICIWFSDLRLTRRRAYRLVSTLGALMLCMAFAAPIQTVLAAEASVDDPCSFMAAGGEPVHSVLKRLIGPAVPIVVPKHYFGGPFVFPKDGQPGADSTFQLYLHRETPLPYLLSEMSGKLSRGIQDWIMLLVYDFESLDVVAEAYLSTYTYAGRHGEKMSSFPGDYGLRKFDIPEDLNAGKIDLLFAGAPDSKTDVMYCNRLGAPYGITNPQCTQTTILNGIRLQYVYNRRYLSDWQSMKNNVARVIYCITKPEDLR